MEKYSMVKLGGNQIMVVPVTRGWFSIDSIDLQSVNGTEMSVAWREPPLKGYVFELRLGSADGKKLGEVMLNPPGNSNQKVANLRILFDPIKESGKQNLYIVSQAKDASESNPVGIVSIELLSN